MDDAKARQQAAFWQSMMDKYIERNDSLQEQQCQLLHRLETMRAAMPAALMSKLNKNGNQVDMTQFISQLGNLPPNDSFSGCTCNPCMAQGRSGQPHSTSGFSSDTSDSCACTDNSQPSTCSCTDVSQQSVATDIVCACNPCADTSATPTPPCSLCTCNPCSASSGFSAESSMLEKISLFSLQSADLYYMNKLHELAIKEKQMRLQLQEMEHREQAYLDTLRQADEMWASMEGCYKQRLSDVQQSGDSTCLKYEKMNQKLMEENMRLTDELKDLKLEWKHCMEQVQGPIIRQLEKERRKSAQLEEELNCASSCMANKECAFMKDMDHLQNELGQTCTNLCNLNAMNNRLKEEMCKLQCKYTELQKDLICQKLSEAHTLQRLQEALEKENQPKCDCSTGPGPGFGPGPGPGPGSGPCGGPGLGPGGGPGGGPCGGPGGRPCDGPGGGPCGKPGAGPGPYDGDDSLYGIARRLSKSLLDVDQCNNECKSLPEDLKDTVRGIKNITDIVAKGEKSKGKAKESPEKEPPSPGGPSEGEPKSDAPPTEPESEPPDETEEASPEDLGTTIIELEVTIQEGNLEIQSEVEVPVEAEGEMPVEAEGEMPVEAEGEMPVEGEGEISVVAEEEILVETEAEIPVEPEVDIPVETEAEIPVEPEVEIPVETEGEILIETEAEIPIEADAEILVETEVEISAEAPPDEEPSDKGIQKSTSPPCEAPCSKGIGKVQAPCEGVCKTGSKATPGIAGEDLQPVEITFEGEVSAEEGGEIIPSAEEGEEIVASAEEAGEIVASAEEGEEIVASAEEAEEIVASAEEGEEIVASPEEAGEIVTSAEEGEEIVGSAEQAGEMVTSAAEGEEIVTTAEEGGETVETIGEGEEIAASAEEIVASAEEGVEIVEGAAEGGEIAERGYFAASVEGDREIVVSAEEGGEIIVGSVEEDGGAVAGVEASPDVITVQGAEELAPAAMTTKVEAAGGVEINVETEVDLYDIAADGVNITTTITRSGMLEVITEGPAGIIETTMTYTESGNIEVTTEITEYPAQGAITTSTGPQELELSDSSTSRVTASTLTPSEPSGVTIASNIVPEQPSEISKISRAERDEESEAESVSEKWETEKLKSDYSASESEGPSGKDSTTITTEGEMITSEKVATVEVGPDVEVSVAVEVGVQPEAVDRSEIGVEVEIVVEVTGEGVGAEEGETSLAVDAKASEEPELFAEAEAPTGAEGPGEEEIFIEAEAKASEEAEAYSEAEAPAGAEGPGEEEIFIEAEAKASEEAEVFAEAEAPIGAEGPGGEEVFIEAEAKASEDAEAFTEAEAPTEAPAEGEIFLEAEVEAKSSEEPETFAEPEEPSGIEPTTEVEIFVEAEVPSAVESEVYIEAEVSAAPIEVEVTVEITQEQPEIITIQAAIDIGEEEEWGEAEPIRHESISEEPYDTQDDSDAFRKGVEEALNKANQDVMAALEEANKNVTDALAKANQDVGSALALALRETQSKANKQIATDAEEFAPKEVPAGGGAIISEIPSSAEEPYVSAVSIAAVTPTAEEEEEEEGDEDAQRMPVAGVQGIPVADAPTDTTKEGWDSVYGEKVSGLPRVSSAERCKGVCSPSYVKLKEVECRDVCATAFKGQLALAQVSGELGAESAAEAPLTAPEELVSVAETPVSAVETPAFAPDELAAEAEAPVSAAEAAEATASAGEVPDISIEVLASSAGEVLDISIEVLASTPEELASVEEPESGEGAIEVPPSAGEELTSAAEAAEPSLEASVSAAEESESAAAAEAPVSVADESISAAAAATGVPASAVEESVSVASTEAAVSAAEESVSVAAAEAPVSAAEGSVSVAATEAPISAAEESVSEAAAEASVSAAERSVSAAATEAPASSAEVSVSEAAAEAPVSVIGEIVSVAGTPEAAAGESASAAEAPALAAGAPISAAEAPALAAGAPVSAAAAPASTAGESPVAAAEAPGSLAAASVSMPGTPTSTAAVPESAPGAAASTDGVSVSVHEAAPSEAEATSSPGVAISAAPDTKAGAQSGVEILMEQQITVGAGDITAEQTISIEITEAPALLTEFEASERRASVEGESKLAEAEAEVSRRGSTTEDQEETSGKGSRRSSDKGSLKEGRTSIPASRSARSSQSDRRSSVERKTKTSMSRESLSRVPVPRRSKLADIKCDCGECECEICSPEMMKKKEERLKAARLAQGQPDDCTCMPNCTCARCGETSQMPGTKRQSGDSDPTSVPGSSRQSKDSQGQKGSRRQSSGGGSMGCCDLEHPDDCDCLECYCEPCGTFRDKPEPHPADSPKVPGSHRQSKDSQGQKGSRRPSSGGESMGCCDLEHPDDCDCLECYCEPCGTFRDKPEPHPADSPKVPGSNRQSKDSQGQKGSRRPSSGGGSMGCCDLEHPDDCDCLECYCEPCGTFRDKTEPHPADCVCLSCLCLPCGDKPCSKPTSKEASQDVFKDKSLTESLKACREESARKVLGRKLGVLADHPPDCDCVICRCCYCPEKKEKPKLHFPPENCKCDECLCVEGKPPTAQCQQTHRSSADSPKLAAVTEEPQEKLETKHAPPYEDCTCNECLCLGAQPSIIPTSDEPPSDSPKLETVPEEVQEEPKATKHTFPLEDCTCDACLCLDGIPFTIPASAELANEDPTLDEITITEEPPTDSTKFDEVPISDELPTDIPTLGDVQISNTITDTTQPEAVEVSMIDEAYIIIDEPPAEGPNVTGDSECSHRPDCDCFECLLVCGITCPDPNAQPTAVELSVETEGIAAMDDATIEIHIEEMEKESVKRKDEMEELQGIIKQIQCACSQAEATASQQCQTKQRASLQNTMSDMQAALTLLQDKCKQKDRMISAMVEELKFRANSKVFDDMLHRLATAGSSEIAPDFDRTEVCKSLPRPHCDPKYGRPSHQLKEPLQCQPCVHPDYPNCPCKLIAEAKPPPKAKPSICSHPNFPNCPCTATGRKLPSIKASSRSIEIKPCSHPDYPDCPCATEQMAAAITESQICSHPDFPNCPCAASERKLLPAKYSAPSVEIKPCDHPNYPNCPCATSERTLPPAKRSAPSVEIKPCDHPNYPNCPCATTEPAVLPQESKKSKPCVCPPPVLSCPQPDGTCPCPKQPKPAAVEKRKRKSSSCPCTRPSSPKRVALVCTNVEEITSTDEASTSEQRTTSTSGRTSTSPKSTSSSGRKSSSSASRKRSCGKSSCSKHETSTSERTSSSGSDRKHPSKRKRSPGSHAKKSCVCSPQRPVVSPKTSFKSPRKSPSPKGSKNTKFNQPHPAPDARISHSARLRKLTTTPPAVSSCLCDTDQADGPSNIPPLNEIVDSSPMEVTEMRRIAPDSLLVKWKQPASKYVTGYEILVDGIIKSRVHSAKRTSAILHTLALKSALHVSIFAITNVGRCQPPANAIFQI